jgi:phosphoketolase
MIILCSPKGWTGPAEADGVKVTGTWRSHQMPPSGSGESRAPAASGNWLRSYRGFIEHGTTTTPFDMTVRNKVSRYHLVADEIHNARRTPSGSADSLTWCRRQARRARRLRGRASGGYARCEGLDAPGQVMIVPGGARLGAA